MRQARTDQQSDPERQQGRTAEREDHHSDPEREPDQRALLFLMSLGKSGRGRGGDLAAGVDRAHVMREEADATLRLVHRRDARRAEPAHVDDLSGLPPMLIQVGGNEVLLDDSRMVAARAEAAGDHVIRRRGRFAARRGSRGHAAQNAWRTRARLSHQAITAVASRQARPLTASERPTTTHRAGSKASTSSRAVAKLSVKVHAAAGEGPRLAGASRIGTLALSKEILDGGQGDW